MTPEFTASLQRATEILRRSQAGKKLSAADLAFCERIGAALHPPAKDVGRPRAEGDGKLPIYDSMMVAAARAHVPLALLKQAKKSGCDAFKWNRVDLEKFLAWLFTREGDEDGVDWSNELKKWLAKRAKLAHDRDARKVLDMDAADTQIRAGMATLFGELDRVFANELPPVLVGKDELGIRKRTLKEIAALKEPLREKFLSLIRREGPPPSHGDTEEK